MAELLALPVLGDRLSAIERARELLAAGKSLRQIAQLLAQEGYQLARGGRWHPATASTLLDG